MADNRHMDMTQGVIWKQLLSFAFPMILGNFFQLMYNAIDAAVVGKHVSDIALAAVGVSNPLCNTIVSFFMGIGTGAGVLISQFFGRKDHEGLQRALHCAIGVTLVLGGLLTILGISASPFILKAMNTPAEVLPEAVRYLQIYFGGLIASLMYNMTSGILRAMGDSKRPLYYLVISAVLHIALNYLFVLGFHWGVAAVAWSTVLSQLLAAVLCIGALMREREEFRFHPRKTNFNPTVAWQIIRIGLPTGVQGAIVSFSNIVIQSVINGFGTDMMAGTITYFRLDSFAIMPMGNLGLAVTTFVGQNVGARQFDRVRKGASIAFRMAVGYAAVSSPLIYVFAPQIVSLFTDSEGVAYYGVSMLRFLAPFFVAHAFIGVFAGAERGAGQTVFPMISSVTSMFALRLLILFGLRAILGQDNIRAIHMTYMATWSLNAIIQTIHYKKSNWLNRVIEMHPK
ncbi:MAG: MATE family efflux transporter [Clostridiaceae bacterium]|nr:MATE family efflux transporter [Clostridiaceae bacterium]